MIFRANTIKREDSEEMQMVQELLTVGQMVPIGRGEQESGMHRKNGDGGKGEEGKGFKYGI
jgi:histone acetyltransferase (RNA polymerase elongator complex component)